MNPSIEYAHTEDGVNIAYDVRGQGPFDLIWVPGFVSHLDAYAGEPGLERFFDRMGSFSRLIRFDKRGTGLSDRLGEQHLQQWADDMLAVMNAVGSQRGALFAISGGGPLAILFAATHPERVSHLVIYASGARYAKSDDYPWGWTAQEGYANLAALENEWGKMPVDPWAPSVKDDARAQQAFFQWQRLSASPAAARSIVSTLGETDVRHALRAISVPTLVIHNRGDQIVPVEHGRYMAEHIPGAKYVELPGNDHFPYFEHPDLILDEIEEFLTGVRPAPETDRVFATVLFTDIVGSTEENVTRGDRQWGGLIELHDAAMKREVERFRGRQIKQTGDGVLATFDGPSRAIQCALSMVKEAHKLGIEIRVGLHSGEIEILGEDVRGLTVNIASRVTGLAKAGEVLASRTVRDIVAGSGISFQDMGTHVLKGVPEEWRIYSVVRP